MREIKIEKPTVDGGTAMSVNVLGDERTLRIVFADMVDGKYDYENGIACDFDFVNSAILLMVLGGTVKKTGDSGILELDGGVKFAMATKGSVTTDGVVAGAMKDGRNVRVKLTPGECAGLRAAITAAFYFLTFAD